MADIEDVRDALVTLVAAATRNGSTSITGGTIAVYAGYPAGQTLDDALAAGAVHVRVNPLPNMTTMLPVSLSGWQSDNIAAQTFTASISGQAITFGGTATAGNVVQVAVTGVSYPYVIKATDTPTKIAAALAALISGATSTGAVLTIPTGTLAVSLTSQGVSYRTVARERSVFAIDIAAPTPAMRTTVGRAVHAALASVSHFTATDGTPCVLQPSTGSFNDLSQRANAYTRSIRVFAIYDVVISKTNQTVGAVLTPATVTNAATTINLGTIASVSGA